MGLPSCSAILLSLCHHHQQQVVEPLYEQQVGDLLDDRDEVGHPTGQEGVPNLTNLGADRTCQYGKLRRVIGRAYRGGQRKPMSEAGGQQEVFINDFLGMGLAECDVT